MLSVYVLCYATSEEELLGFFTTARRALRPGGRFVAATLNPDYGRGVDYYAGYGFTLTQHRLQVTARWWSRQMYDKAATTVGLVEPTWTEPVVSDVGIATCGSDYWAAYLRAPQALILETKPIQESS